jgi:hypothetical protein
MQLKRLLTPILVVGLVTLAGAGCGRVTVRGADSASDNTQATQVSTDHGSKVIRDHPEDDPLPLEGNAYLQVGFALTNPNTQGRLSVPVDLPVGQPQIKEVLLARNVGGDMSFGIGLQRKAVFRVTELSKPTRLVVEVRTR